MLSWEDIRDDYIHLRGNVWMMWTEFGGVAKEISKLIPRKGQIQWKICKIEELWFKDSHLPVAPGWCRGRGAEHASILQNKSQRGGKRGLQRSWCLYLQRVRSGLYLCTAQSFTYISSRVIHHNLINTLSSHPVSSLMVLTGWIRRHRHNLGDPVNWAAAYLCLFRGA